MIPDCIKDKAGDLLREYFTSDIVLNSECPVLGGDINYAAKLSANRNDFFIKWNYAAKYPRMFESEMSGLELLRNTQTFIIPKVIGYSDADEYSFLLMEFINQGRICKKFWAEFGIKLARLHQNTSDYFGLENDNYIGSLCQNNKKYLYWNQFFIEERMEPQLKIARDSKKIDAVTNALFQRFFNRIDDIFPVEPPALLHGDLWQGNYLTTENGEACLIDHAVYYGHREMDIAMTKLFGGFNSDFYESYNEVFPMETGWQYRTDYCNLYPLMVHVNLFGEGYVNSVVSILKRI